MESRALSWGGEFNVPAQEAAYCKARLPEYIRQARLAFQCSCLLNALFLLSDWRFHGQRHFYFAVCSRLVILAVSVAAWIAIRKVRSFSHFELICTAWTVPTIAAGAILVSPHTDVALLVAFILPVVFYLVVPVSFRRTLIFGLTCSAATLSARIAPVPFSRSVLGLTLGMFMMNVVLILVLSHAKRLRRLEWAATQAEHAANQKLSAGRDLLQRILKAVPTPLLISARDDGSLLQANDAAAEYFGPDFSKGSFRLEQHIDTRDWERLGEKLSAEGQVTGFETRLHLPNGLMRDVLLQAAAIPVDATDAIMTTLVDITHRKKVEAIMERLANTDPLSGLPNRARFFKVAVDKIREAERASQPLAVFMVDIDYFKRINDTHGHNAGDLALKAFAELCRTWIRRQDIVARLGGEEFGLLLPGTNALSALALADRLRAAVEDLQLENLPTTMTISIGVSEVLSGESTVDAALSRADQALYTAKRSGRNRVVLYRQAKAAASSGGQG